MQEKVLLTRFTCAVQVLRKFLKRQLRKGEDPNHLGQKLRGKALKKSLKTWHLETDLDVEVHIKRKVQGIS